MCKPKNVNEIEMFVIGHEPEVYGMIIGLNFIGYVTKLVLVHINTLLN